MRDEILKIIEDNLDTTQAKKMSAYMKDKFVFAGISKPKLKELIKPFLKQTAKTELDWDLVFELWDIPYREAQYIALEYLQKHRKEIKPFHIDNLKRLITEKSWWETVDTIDSLVGEAVLQDEKLKSTLLLWANDDNLWLRRVAINFQQAYKEKTDTDIFEKIILMNLGSKEFFIDKAIGWSLRDYAKVNPEWVNNFVEKYESKLSPLSIREALKNIK